MYYDRKKLYIVSAMYALSLFLVLFFHGKLACNVCLAVVSVLSASVCALYVKKRQAFDLRRKDVAFISALTAIAAILILYLLGLRFGFYKTGITVRTFYEYIIPITVTVISVEIFRSILLSQKSRVIRILSYFLFAFSDILLFAEENPFSSVASFMSLLGLAILPAFTSGLLYYIVSFRYGAYAVIPYRLIMALYPHILPFGVAIPRAIYCFIRIVFPVLMAVYIYSLFKKRVMLASRKRTKFSTVLSVVCVVLMFIGIAFVADMFTYRPIVVASDSMRDELSRGDLTVYKAYDGQYIQNGDVILFKRGKSTIIHRVVKMKKINGVIRYYTKGDANEGIDSGYITDEDIVGIATMKIKYIGYPTVWLYDMFNK